jgi:hypothetical protein
MSCAGVYDVLQVRIISDIKGGIAGMFWRFLVADDLTVDR